jgi:hypothetical protein
MVIYKYPLELVVEQTLLLPKNSLVLALQLQLGVPTVWVSIPDTGADREIVTFSTYGTGQQVDQKVEQYLDTYQLNGFVWHVFYRRSL